MAVLTITIPDAVKDRVIDAICIRGGYSATSGLTKIQFAKQYILDTMKGIVSDHESSTAVQTAGTTARAKVESEIILS